jgi:hypothetical protein
MIRNLALPAMALAAVALVASHPAFAHDTPHKRLVALVAVVLPFLVLDILLRTRRRSRARSSSLSPARSSRARARAGARW